MRTILSIVIGITTVSTVYGQGYFNFNNLESGGISLTSSVAGEGNAGDYVGSSYNVSFYYEMGVHSGFVDPTTMTLSSISPVMFYGVTGAPPAHSPFQDGAGLFDGSAVVIPGTTDLTMISLEAVVWYAGPGATSYASALAHGYNAGYSSLVPVTLAWGADDNIHDVSSVSTFAFGFNQTPAPEPSTIGLGALGGVALFLFRRGK